MMRTKIWCIVSDVEGIQPLQIDKFFCTLAVDQVEGIAEILLFITRQRNIIVAHYNFEKVYSNPQYVEPIKAAVQRNVVQISEKFFSALQCLLNKSFFVAHEEMALRRFASLCELQKKNGVQFGDQYKNDKGCKTFISHIAQVEKGKIQSTVSDSRFISIIIRWIY